MMWVLPTYRRQPLAQRCLDSLKGAAPGLVIVDGGPRYDDLRLPPDWSMMYCEQNIGMLPQLNHAFKIYPDEPWYGLIVDDCVVMADEGWAKRMIEAAGPLGICGCRDGFPGEQYKDWPHCPVFGGELLRALGHWAIPGCRHTYADDAWRMIMVKFNCFTALDDVLIDHLDVRRGELQLKKDETSGLAYSFVNDDWKAWGAFRDSGEWDRALARVAEAYAKL